MFLLYAENGNTREMYIYLPIYLHMLSEFEAYIRLVLVERIIKIGAQVRVVHSPFVRVFAVHIGCCYVPASVPW